MTELRNIPLSDIKRAKVEIRTERDVEALNQLAANIKEDGVGQPITVRPSSNGDYEIVAGHRRFDASAIAGLETIPAIVEDMDDEEALVRSFTENELREDMTPLDKARALRTIMEVKGWNKRDLENRGITHHSTASELLLFLEEHEKGIVPDHEDFSNPKDYGLAKTTAVRRAFLSRKLGHLDDMKREVMAKVAEDGLSISQSRVLADAVVREASILLEGGAKEVNSESSDTMKAIFNTDASDPAFEQLVRALAAVYRKRGRETKKKEENPNVEHKPMKDYVEAARTFGLAVREATRQAQRGMFSTESVHFLSKWHHEIVDSLEALETTIKENGNG